MIQSFLRNVEKHHDWTIVHDRAIPPAHSVTFAALEQNPIQAPPTRRGLVRTLTPPACRWVESNSTSTGKSSGLLPYSSKSLPPEIPIQQPSTATPVVQSQSISTTTTTSTTSERIVDTGPRLPQRLPVGSILSPQKTKRSSTPIVSNQIKPHDILQ